MTGLVIDKASYPSPNYTERRGGGHPQFLVMHYTACPLEEALVTLTSKAAEVSAHYLLPPSGNTVFNLVDESKRAWHAGRGFWRDVTDINSFSIGIENVNWGYTYGWVPAEPTNRPLRYTWSSIVHLERRLGELVEAKSLLFPKKTWHSFPEGQVNTLIALAKDILARNKIDSENVVGHSDIAPQRKVDPGPLFPWEKLAQQGVGVWYDRAVDRVRSIRPCGISIGWVQQSLSRWGYSVPQNGFLDSETKNVVRAFQMHFRPESFDGVIDEECSNILDLLLCQRLNRTN